MTDLIGTEINIGDTVVSMFVNTFHEGLQKGIVKKINDEYTFLMKHDSNRILPDAKWYPKRTIVITKLINK